MQKPLEIQLKADLLLQITTTEKQSQNNVCWPQNKRCRMVSFLSTFSSKGKYTDTNLVYGDFMSKNSKQLWYPMDVFKNAVLARKITRYFFFCSFPVALHNQHNFLFLVLTCTEHHRKHDCKGPWEVRWSSPYPKAGSVLPKLVLKDVSSVLKDSLWRVRGHCCLSASGLQNLHSEVFPNV